MGEERPGGVSGNDTRVVPCSRSAHDQKVLARRAQLDHCGRHSQRDEGASLEGGRLISRCARPMRLFQSFIPLIRGVAKIALYCAHRATRVHLNDPSKLARFSLRNGTCAGPTAAVERAHSDRARSGSKGSARVSFHSFHRGGSASTETMPVASLLLKLARYLSGMGPD